MGLALGQALASQYLRPTVEEGGCFILWDETIPM